MIKIDMPTNIKEYSNVIVIDLTQTRSKLSYIIHMVRYIFTSIEVLRYR